MFGKKKDLTKKTVFVGMSGGVDSSVSAALLKKAGYDVVGVFIKVWSPDWLPCTWPLERRDAIRVAATLDIPLLTFDFEKEYKKEVVDYMIAEYAAGRTPNPDVMCNKSIKFGAFLKKAQEMGADFVATGHYAQAIPMSRFFMGALNIKNRDMGIASRLFGRVASVGRAIQNTRFPVLKASTGNIALGVAADTNKDQSYFLWTLTQDQLRHALFPIGHLQKAEVRKLAAKFKLPVAEKKDSQGLCFIGHVDMKEFLGRYLTLTTGDVLDEKGGVIGVHDGAALYTLGERHGFTITEKTPDDAPYYIVAKDHEKNTLTVSHSQLPSTAKKEVAVSSISWTAGEPNFSKKYQARVRYRQSLAECVLTRSDKGVVVVFDEPQIAVTPGQSLVVYDSSVCLGGGIIS